MCDKGVGHKGERLHVTRYQAYYKLFPLRQAVYPTEEYVEMYAKYAEENAQRAKVSPYAMKTKEELSTLLLEIPMSMSTDWSLTQNHIKIALRYNVNTHSHTGISRSKINIGFCSRNYLNLRMLGANQNKGPF